MIYAACEKVTVHQPGVGLSGAVCVQVSELFPPVVPSTAYLANQALVAGNNREDCAADCFRATLRPEKGSE